VNFRLIGAINVLGKYLNFMVVTVRLSLNFIIGCWGYTLDREGRVSGETCVTVLCSS
jgi:hypothetical protein